MSILLIISVSFGLKLNELYCVPITYHYINDVFTVYAGCKN